MARRVIEVFLSSTALDLADYRAAVHDRLTSTGRFFCIRQEDFGAQNAGAVEFCRREVKKADIFVGLIGLRRGWEPDGDEEQRSITEMEHDWARDASRPRYMWVSPDDFPVPGHMRESDEQHARQMAFRKRVMAGGERIVSQQGFGSPEALAGKVVKQLLLADIVEEILSSSEPLAALPGLPAPSKEEQAPAIAAAVAAAVDTDEELLALAKNPAGIDVAALEAKLMAREKEVEAKAARKRAEFWRHIGALAFLGDTQKALAAYENATSLDPDDPEGWRYLGELRYRLGDYDAASTAFVTLQELGDRASNLQTQSIACLRFNWIERSTGNLNEAERLAARALQLAQLAQWQEGMARAYVNLGNIYEAWGDPGRAEDMYQKALRLEEELGRKEGMAAAYGNLGVISQTRGDLVRAEDMQLKALKLNEELGRKEGMANAYGNLGLIYKTRGDLDRAEDMQLNALKLEEELGRKEGMADSYVNLGIIHKSRGDLVRAEDMQQKALKLYDELGGKEGMALAYGNLGNIYQARKDKAKMCVCWRKARDLLREMGLEDKAAAAEKWLRAAGCDVPQEKGLIRSLLDRFRRA
jgi:protein O-GlcNAc transferase